MERLAVSNAHQKSDDPQRSYYLNQKKVLEINPRHPLMKELLRRVVNEPEDPIARDMAVMLYRTATLRSGFMLQETSDFALSVEQMMRQTLGLPQHEMPDEEVEIPETNNIEEAEEIMEDEEHDEL